MEEFKKSYRLLNDAQRQAVDQLEGPILVIAGPGTGKTQLLTSRVANILRETDVTAKNILCLTFTDAAAHTMRERLTAMIGQDAYNVSISTYHSFGSELIRRFPSYFNDTISARAIDELGIDSLLRTIQDELPYSNSLKPNLYLNDIKSLLSDSKRALLSASDIKKVADDNAEFFKAINPLLKEHSDNLSRISKNSGPALVKLANQTRKIKSLSSIRYIEPISEIWQKDLELAIEEWEESKKTTALTIWKGSWLAKDSSNNFIVGAADNSKKLIDFATIYSAYELSLKQNDLFDYDDMISRAVSGLENHPDLKFTLQEQYLYILLDEFQDTNQAQLKLIELLTDNPVNEGRPNVLAVGDDDQAIYAFQGANYSHMLTFINQYKNVSVIPLSINYRSLEPIVKFSSSISSQIEERLQGALGIGDKSLSAERSTKSDSAVMRFDFKSDIAQFAWVADQIKKLVKNGTPASDIAVLAPQHKYLEPLVPYIHHAGLSVRYEKRDNVLDDPIINSLVVMSKLILALANRDYQLADSYWPEVLSADWWSLPTQLIWELSWKVYDEKTHWSNVLVEAPKTRVVSLFFVRLASLAKQESLENILDYVMGITSINLHEKEIGDYRSPFYEHFFGDKKIDSGDTSFWSLLSNLTVLRQHLREYKLSENSVLSLEDFINFIDEHRQANINLINTSPYYESVNAVQLMTAYRSKGQEFSAVFVLGCLDEVWGDSARTRSSNLSVPPNLKFIRYAGSSTDEKIRLFYVALTRAKNYLYLTSYRSTYTGKPLSLLRYLMETIDESGQIVSPLLPSKNKNVPLIDTVAPELVTLRLYWEQRHENDITKPQIRSLLEPRLRYFQLSPTHVNQFTDVLSDGPKFFLINTLLRFPSAKQPSAEYGSAIHETLSWIHNFNLSGGHLPTSKQAINQFKQLLGLKRLGDKQHALLLERGKRVLSAYLSQRAATIRPEDQSEYNFRREGVFVGNTHLTGSIDKLMIDKPNKKVTIVDYKTGRSYRNWESNIVLHRYRQQLYMYKLLVENSRSFSDYTVDDAYLEFVEPDTSGKINELHLSFKDDEQDHISEVAKGVWDSIISFRFPDVSEYPRTISGIKLFEEDLKPKNKSHSGDLPE